MSSDHNVGAASGVIGPSQVTHSPLLGLLSRVAFYGLTNLYNMLIIFGSHSQSISSYFLVSCMVSI